jgi:hypothetical protein
MNVSEAVPDKKGTSGNNTNIGSGVDNKEEREY